MSGTDGVTHGQLLGGSFGVGTAAVPALAPAPPAAVTGPRTRPLASAGVTLGPPGGATYWQPPAGLRIDQIAVALVTIAQVLLWLSQLKVRERAADALHLLLPTLPFAALSLLCSALLCFLSSGRSLPVFHYQIATAAQVLLRLVQLEESPRCWPRCAVVSQLSSLTFSIIMAH